MAKTAEVERWEISKHKETEMLVIKTHLPDFLAFSFVIPFVRNAD